MKTARNTAPLVLFLIAVALLALRFGWQWSLAVWLFAALAALPPGCRSAAGVPKGRLKRRFQTASMRGNCPPRGV